MASTGMASLSELTASFPRAGKLEDFLLSVVLG
jgi:hypothetical protein